VSVASVLDWRSELSELQARLGELFGRAEPRRQAGLYLEGLLSAVERKNGWQLAEHLGDARPWRTQRLLSHVQWDDEAARDLCGAYVIEPLADREAVLIVDETGFLKKGTKSAGVARQYSGTAGRIENCQIGVFLAYASGNGHALIDRELYLPKEWAEDPARRKAASIPEKVAFATKPELARRMIARAIAAGVPFAWVLGDEVYGADRRLRLDLEQQERPFLLAIRSNEKLWSMLDDRMGQHTAATLAAAVPAEALQRLSAGAGAKGERFYDWARVRLMRLQQPPWDHWLLVRRHPSKPDQLAYYVVFGPADTSLTTLARVAGRRWAIE
jgi:SRSO17 transposase